MSDVNETRRITRNSVANAAVDRRPSASVRYNPTARTTAARSTTLTGNRSKPTINVAARQAAPLVNARAPPVKRATPSSGGVGGNGVRSAVKPTVKLPAGPIKLPTIAKVSTNPPRLSATKPEETRKRTIFQRTTKKSGSSSGGSSADSAPKSKRKLPELLVDLFSVDLNQSDYYTLLNLDPSSVLSGDVKLNANYLVVDANKVIAEISKAQNVNNDEAPLNDVNDIQKVLAEAVSVLTVPEARNVYNRIQTEKQKLILFKNGAVKRVYNDVTETYNNIVLLKNDTQEFMETNIEDMLITAVHTTIKYNVKNKHYKTTKTNRIRIEWHIDENDYSSNGGIDEEYLREYFKNDRVVGLVMCTGRRNCAVAEVLTSGTVTAIIERESKRGNFIVRDYTEAEFGMDRTNFSPQIDKLRLIMNEIESFEDSIRRMKAHADQYLEPHYDIADVVAEAEKIQRQYIEEDEDFDDDDGDDDDDDQYIDIDEENDLSLNV
jgi:hypothetical protein